MGIIEPDPRYMEHFAPNGEKIIFLISAIVVIYLISYTLIDDIMNILKNYVYRRKIHYGFKWLYDN